ncbi:MAG: AAA family ATPase [Lachnospiraceae bacterium]|nr:AAA family ATPase [Lachnospiraceae bacterium]
MRIQKISLKNFRGIPNIDIDLSGKSVIFFGINGVGKSSILRAVDLLFANIIGKLQGTKRRLAELELDDIYDHTEKARIEAVFP